MILYQFKYIIGIIYLTIGIKGVYNYYIDFQTDFDISKKFKNTNKQLVEFKADSDILFCDLDDNDHKWDQFELNKKKFNVETTYHENHYTTELDHNSIPFEVKRKADKIAQVDFIIQEILRTTNTDNIHMKEERGLIAQHEGDEEERYSSVYR